MGSTYAPNYSGPNGARYDNAWNTIDGVVVHFKATLDDGFQVRDLADWHSIVARSYDVAKDVFGGDFGKDELTDLVIYIYWAINPNWPSIPDIVEKRMEKKFIEKLAIPLAVGAAWDAVESYIKAKGL